MLFFSFLFFKTCLSLHFIYEFLDKLYVYRLMCVCLCAFCLGLSLVCAIRFPVHSLTLFPSDGLQCHLMSGMQPCAGGHLIGVTSGPQLARGI